MKFEQHPITFACNHPAITLVNISFLFARENTGNPHSFSIRREYTLSMHLLIGGGRERERERGQVFFLCVWVFLQETLPHGRKTLCRELSDALRPLCDELFHVGPSQ